MSGDIQGGGKIYFALLVIGIILMLLSSYAHRDATFFQGIAETSQTTINSKTSVEIKRILVIEGQEVKAGDKLAELLSPELSLKIANIEHNLRDLAANTAAKRKEIQSTISQLRVQDQTIVDDISGQIAELDNRSKITRKITSDLRSFDLALTGDPSIRSPIALKISTLENQMRDKRKEIRLAMDSQENALKDMELQTKIQMDRLNGELDILREKNSQLDVFAPFPGIIGTIGVRSGENIAPFAPILTLSSLRPSLVKGYIHETLYSKLKVGDKIEISSTDGKKRIDGQVAGLGNRIIQFPPRVLKHPTLMMWGREIVITIPENNDLILGEKVTIEVPEAASASTTFGLLTLSLPKANAISRQGTDPEYSIPIIAPRAPFLEASGAVYLPEREAFAVISDETEDKQPVVFLMDTKGKVVEEMEIQGMDEIDDLESIARLDGNRFLIAASLSHTKKGKLRKERRQLALIRYDRQGFSLEQSIDLYEKLEFAAAGVNTDWSEFLRRGMKNKTLNVEGIGIGSDKELWVAFKEPLYNGEALILGIYDFERLFQGNDIKPEQIRIAQKLRLKPDERLSDIFFRNGVLFFTVTNSFGRGGAFYKFEKGMEEQLVRFETLRPEGIAAKPGSKGFFLFFDHGGDQNSTFMEVLSQ
jgi:multidrug resistance efflux pump